MKTEPDIILGEGDLGASKDEHGGIWRLYWQDEDDFGQKHWRQIECLHYPLEGTDSQHKRLTWPPSVDRILRDMLDKQIDTEGAKEDTNE